MDSMWVEQRDRVRVGLDMVPVARKGSDARRPVARRPQVGQMVRQAALPWAIAGCNPEL